MNSYQINNYNIQTNMEKNVYRPGTVFIRETVKEDIQNSVMFNYSIPKLQHPPCLTVDMRPQETRHDLLGVNMCDTLREKYSNKPTSFINNAPCLMDPFIPSWNKYSASINLESDMKNVFRKRSCDENSVYMPSTNSMMYSKATMPKDSTMESGYYALKEQEVKHGHVSRVFMEDTRQARMGTK